MNPELAKIFEADQADRSGQPDQIDWAHVGPRDVERRARVDEILKANGAHASKDFYNAAMVFQHGREVRDYQRAHELAMKAVALDPNDKQARWLAAAAKDRELMNLDKPQLYGTQFKRDGDGPWELYPVDPSVTDEERARWNVPPLAEAQRRAEEMNRK
jgi:hypothetical protein